MGMPGRLRGALFGRYRVLETVGAGAMGVVYRCWDELLLREVAIKTMHPGTFRDDEARALTRNEALALSSMKHPNIAVVHDLRCSKGRDFLVMEFIEGTTLADRLAGEGKLPVWEVFRLGIQLASALGAAHAKQIVHRDIKPGNLRVTPVGTLKVLDFGIARLLDGSQAGLFDSIAVGSRATSNTASTTAIAGTIPYMSPERILGSPADERSDVYGLGVVLYEMATGTHPFSESSDMRVIDRILEGEPLPPRSLNRCIPPVLEDAILKSMQKRPERRFQSAAGVLTTLQEVVTACIPWKKVVAHAAASVMTTFALGSWGDGF